MNDPVRARNKPNPGAGFGDFEELRQVWSNFPWKIGQGNQGNFRFFFAKGQTEKTNLTGVE